MAGFMNFDVGFVLNEILSGIRDGKALRIATMSEGGNTEKICKK